MLKYFCKHHVFKVWNVDCQMKTRRTFYLPIIFWIWFGQSHGNKCTLDWPSLLGNLSICTTYSTHIPALVSRMKYPTLLNFQEGLRLSCRQHPPNHRQYLPWTLKHFSSLAQTDTESPTCFLQVLPQKWTRHFKGFPWGSNSTSEFETRSGRMVPSIRILFSKQNQWRTRGREKDRAMWHCLIWMEKKNNCKLILSEISFW